MSGAALRSAIIETRGDGTCPIASSTPLTIQHAMSEMLGALGYRQMSEDVLTETSPRRLRIYAAGIVRSTPSDCRERVRYLLTEAGVLS